MKKAILICSFFLLLLSNLLYANQLSIVFRLDDYTLVSSMTKDSIIKIFFKNEIPLVVGIIPCDSDEVLICNQNFSFLTRLKSAVSDGRVEISLHGLTHKKITKYGEFGGLNENEQKRRVVKGKYLLDSIFQTEVISFIPPWNSYDDNTLNVLNEAGFKIVSSSITDGALSRNDICYYPHTTGELHLLKTIISTNIDREGVIVVMIHDYDFTTNGAIESLDTLLSFIRHKEHLRFYTFKSLYETGNFVSKEQIESLWHKNLLSKVLKLDGVIYPLKYIKRIQLFNALMYLLLSLIAFLISYWIILRKKNTKIYSTITLLIYEFCLFLVVYNHLLSPIKLLILAILVSVLLPIVFLFVPRSKL